MTNELDSITRRAVFYLGTYGVKFALADVKLSERRIEELYYYSKSNIPYKNSIVYSNHCRFTKAIMEQGLNSILAHQKNAYLNFSTDRKPQYYGVANEVFLKASNGQEFLNHIYQLTGIKIDIVDKEQELEIRYDSVIAALGKNQNDDLLVWESTKEQLYFLTKKKQKLQIHKISPSYEEFNTILKRELNREIILNPISKAEIEKAIKIAEKTISIPQKIANKIKDYKIITGIGPIHNYVIQHYVNFYNISSLTGCDTDLDLWEYNKTNLRSAIDALAELTNQDLADLMYNKRSYYNVDKEISNMILVYAVMDKLSIEKIQTLNPKNTFGLLVKQ